MKMVVYRGSDGAWYLTTEKNYNSYIKNARAIHRLDDVKSIADMIEFINNWCLRYGDNPDDFTAVY